MSEFYTLKIAGLERQLEKFPVSDKLDIAAFIIFGDVELTIKASAELLKKLPEFDVILTPEAKSIPIAYEMSRQSGKPYIIARKGVKVYMRNPLSVSAKQKAEIQGVCFLQSDKNAYDLAVEISKII